METVSLRKYPYDHWTYQKSAFKRYHSDRHLSEFLPTRWRQKSAGVDMEQNYVTVTRCLHYENERQLIIGYVSGLENIRESHHIIF